MGHGSMLVVVLGGFLAAGCSPEVDEGAVDTSLRGERPGGDLVGVTDAAGGQPDAAGLDLSEVLDGAHDAPADLPAAPDMAGAPDGGPGKRKRLIPNDFDGDGKSDLAVFEPSAGKWYVVKAAAPNAAIVVGESWGFLGGRLAATDFNGDGKADLGIYDPPSGKWFILDRANAALLASGQPDAVWGGPTQLPLLGDFDGDGRSDLAVVDAYSGVFRVARLTPNPTAPTKRIDAMGGYSTSLKIGAAEMTPVACDFDGDGTDDLGMFDPTPTTGAVWHLRLSSSPGTIKDVAWGFSTTVPVPGYYDSAAKKKCALGVWDRAGGKWYFMTVDGRGLWGGTAGVAYGSPGSVPLAGDYNGDGVWDLAMFDPSTRRFYVYDLVSGKNLAWSVAVGRAGSSVLVAGGAYARGGKNLSVGAEESPGAQVASAVGRYPTIAVDQRDQPHIVADVDRAPKVLLFDKVGGPSAAWAGAAQDVTSSFPGAGQYYQATIEVDSFDRAWISGNPQDTAKGIGLILRTNVAESPSSPAFLDSPKMTGGTSTDIGVLSVFPFSSNGLPEGYAVEVCNDAVWRQYRYDPASGSRMTAVTKAAAFPLDHWGESVAFKISKVQDATAGAVWHAVTGGGNKATPIVSGGYRTGWSQTFQTQSAHYQQAPASVAASPGVVWVDGSAISLGGDHYYPGVVTDALEAKIAYLVHPAASKHGQCPSTCTNCASDNWSCCTCAGMDGFADGFVVNIYDGGKASNPLVFAANAPYAVHDADFAPRHHPQGAPASRGGAFLTWSYKSTVMIQHIAKDGARGSPIQVCAGTVPSLALDAQGALHLAYVNGGVKYRRLLTY